MNYIALILAAGKSNRFKMGGRAQDKMLVTLNGIPVVEHAIRWAQNQPAINAIYIAASRSNKRAVSLIAKKYRKVKKVINGADTRFESVKKSVHVAKKDFGKALNKNVFFVIHNGANPYVGNEEFGRATSALLRNKKIMGVAVGRPVTATLKRVDTHGHVTGGVVRDNLWEMQTPQVVRAQEFLNAIGLVNSKDNSQKLGGKYLDDLSVLEAAGYGTAVVLACPKNKKITFADDLSLCQNMDAQAVWYAIGEDRHLRNIKRKGMVLGGVKFPAEPSVNADSDGDVILHALCNAIASGIGEKSLGSYATRMCKDGIKDSKKYVAYIMQIMRQKMIKINYVSLSVEADSPKIDSRGASIKASLARILNIPSQHIGITATSGNQEHVNSAIRATAIVTFTSC